MIQRDGGGGERRVKDKTVRSIVRGSVYPALIRSRWYNGISDRLAMDWKKKKYNTISIFRARPFDIVINFWDEGGKIRERLCKIGNCTLFQPSKFHHFRAPSWIFDVVEPNLLIILLKLLSIVEFNSYFASLLIRRVRTRFDSLLRVSRASF